jgi:hypothetical protein
MPNPSQFHPDYSSSLLKPADAGWATANISATGLFRSFTLEPAEDQQGRASAEQNYHTSHSKNLIEKIDIEYLSFS